MEIRCGTALSCKNCATVDLLSPAVQVFAPPANVQVQRLTAAAAHRAGGPREVSSEVEARLSKLAETRAVLLCSQVESGPTLSADVPIHPESVRREQEDGGEAAWVGGHGGAGCRWRPSPSYGVAQDPAGGPATSGSWARWSQAAQREGRSG